MEFTLSWQWITGEQSRVCTERSGPCCQPAPGLCLPSQQRGRRAGTSSVPYPGLEAPGCLNLCKVELISHYHMILEQPTSLLQPMCKIRERSYEEHMEKHLQAQTSTYGVSCRKSQSHPREGDHKRALNQKQTVLCMFFSSQKHPETEAFPKHMPCIFAPSGSLKAARGV